MTSPIDRERLVRRHNPIRTISNAISPMQVGNGCFAFGTDITGLQTFVPFATLSQWGWKNDPLPLGVSLDDFQGQTWQTQGRDVRYDMPDSQNPLVSQWLTANPNRMSLGRIGLWAGEEPMVESDLDHCIQILDLWTGTIHSVFNWQGTEVKVETCVHPEKDAVAATIISNSLRMKKLSVFLDFPYSHGKSKFSAPYCGVWDQPDSHTTVTESTSISRALFRRQIDDAVYYVAVHWNRPDGRIRHLQDHQYVLELQDNNASSLSFSVHFTSQSPGSAFLSADTIHLASQHHWPTFWQTGGAISLTSSDPRAHELERRIILSQYVMATNALGQYPPQESGLVNIGWYGKFHLEMNWWHTAYLALFNRWSLFTPSLDIYQRFLETSRQRAAEQGYKGARWPKMTDPSGRMAPGEINSLLIWQQPHPLVFAQLEYRANSTTTTLEKWKDVIEATADFMASFAVWNQETAVYDLPSPMHLVPENTNPRETYNPAFELEYWRLGLSIATHWWERLSLEPSEAWSAVRDKLAPLPVQGNMYVLWPKVQNMWTGYNFEHPVLAGLYGWLPGSKYLDLPTMEATTRQIWKTWKFDDCWGWDFAVLALNAARMGCPSEAVDFLLHESMPVDDVGLAPGGTRVPFPYLPCSGALLYAVAFMAAGWDGAPDGVHAPGFPSEGWEVRCEGLSKAL